MKRFASLLPLPGCLALALAFAPGCGGDDDDEIDADLTVLDEASDEIFLTIRDLVDRGEVTTDDDAAAHMLAPANGADLSAGAAPTFTWEHGAALLRHGRTTGDFVWLSIDCPGLAEPVDLVAIETEEWTVDADHWAAISEAALASDSAQCTAGLVSAYVDRGVVREGPYRGSTTPSYTITD
jgi:hypothetical protein